MMIFSVLTSIIIFKVTMNDHLDEITNNISSATVGSFSSNFLDSQSNLSPVITPNIKKKIVTNSKTTPFPVEYEYSPYLDEGQSVVFPGTPGQIITEYEQVIVNGKLMNITKLSNNNIAPKAQKILIGIRQPLTSSKLNITLDENGCPTEYEELLTNKVATAYTADFGARTSTNKIPKVGYVAVDPKKIPYHSVLYIKCHNNQLFGVFTAEDTGSALRKGSADIDIYMLNEYQCMKFGRQKIDIYILSY